MSTFSTSLQLQLIGNGEQTGTWGTTTNTNWNLIEQAVAGVTSITMLNADYTLTVVNGASDEARNMVLQVSGTNSAIRKVVAPLVNKVYVVYNNTSGGYAITIGGSTGSTVTIPNGASTLVYCDGTNFYGGLTGTTGNWNVPGTVTATTFSGAGTGLTGTASSLTVGNAAYAVAAVTATSAASATNLSGGNTGYVPYQSAAGTTALLAPGTAGQVLATAGAGSAPYWTSVSGGGGGTVTSVSGTGTVSGLTLSGNVTTSGSLTLGGSLSLTNTQITTGLGYIPANSSLTPTLSGSNSWTGTTNTFSNYITAPSYNYSGTTSMYSDGSTYINASINSGTVWQFRPNSNGGNYSLVNLRVGYDLGSSTGSTWLFYSKATSSSAAVAGVFDCQYNSGNAIQAITGYTAAPLAKFYYGSATSSTSVGSITTDGTNTTYGTSSDRRLKDSISDYSNSGAIIDALKPRTFTWKATGKSAVGFIADEMQQVVPEAVSGNPNDESYQNIDCSSPTMIANIIAELQSLRKRVAELEAK